VRLGCCNGSVDYANHAVIRHPWSRPCGDLTAQQLVSQHAPLSVEMQTIMHAGIAKHKHPLGEVGAQRLTQCCQLLCDIVPHPPAFILHENMACVKLLLCLHRHMVSVCVQCMNMHMCNNSREGSCTAPARTSARPGGCAS
jgi:hypothetical protein